jgi:hypothetical protein
MWEIQDPQVKKPPWCIAERLSPSSCRQKSASEFEARYPSGAHSACKRLPPVLVPPGDFLDDFRSFIGKVLRRLATPGMATGRLKASLKVPPENGGVSVSAGNGVPVILLQHCLPSMIGTA